MENIKKNNLINILENHINQESTKEEVISFINSIKNDQDLLNEELIKQIINEFLTSFEELSRKDIKQRILMLKTY